MAKLRTTEDYLPSNPEWEQQGIVAGGVDPSASTLKPPAPPAPKGGYDLEAFRNQWYGKGDVNNVQGWLDQHKDITSGVTIKNGQHAYDPNGNYIADLIGNLNDPNQAKHAQFLDGVATGKQAQKGAKGKSAKMPAMGGVGGGGINMSSSAGPSMDEIGNELKKLFPGGLWNQGLVDSRVGSANDAIERQRKSRLATNRAALAERGLISGGQGESGAELGAMNRMDEDIFNQQIGAVRDIHDDETQRADARMMSALQTAAGLSSDQARLIIDKFRAESDAKLGAGQLALGNRNAGIQDKLGMGNLALGNLNASNNYNLGMGGLGIEADKLDGADIDRLIRLMEGYGSGANTSSGGYVK